ncbi:MAG: zf-HC2 domain-containing protein [Candidatus Sumerlaeia bacterium]
MNRHLTEDERSALILGITPPGEAERLRRHLDGCESCRRELADDRQILEGLEELQPGEPSTERWDNLVHEAATRPPVVIPVRSSFEPMVFWLARAAVLALVFVSGFWAGGAREALNAPRAPVTRASAPADETPSKIDRARVVGMADDRRTGCFTTCVQLDSALSTATLNSDFWR